MQGYPNGTTSAPTSATTFLRLGIDATEAAAAAMFGHLRLDITADSSKALACGAAYYLTHCEHPADKRGGRYWMLALIRCADIPKIIDEAHVEAAAKAKQNGKPEPTRVDVQEQFFRFHLGVKKKWLVGVVGAVVEIDHLPRDEQERRYAALAAATGLTWTLQVFSGGKSVHAYLAFDRLVPPDDPIRLEVAHLLIAILEGDPAVIDPGRLTRLPGWRDPDGRREQPVVHLDTLARYAPELIRDRLRAHAQAIGIVNVPRAVEALKRAKRLDDAARAPRDGVISPTTPPQDALDLVARLRATRFDPAGEDLDLAADGAWVLRLAARLHSASEEEGGEAGYEMREHADRLRATWASPANDDLVLARTMLGITTQAGVVSSFKGTRHLGLAHDGDHEVYFVSREEMAIFAPMAKGTRVLAPCCGNGGSGRSDGSGIVMHEAGEAPRLWCHRCGHVVMAARIDPDALAAQPGMLWFGVSHTPRNDSDLVDVDGGVCQNPLASATPPEEVGGRYLLLGRDDLPPGIHVLAADTGTGKTTRLAEILREARTRGERVLVVVHRRTLARDAASPSAYDLDCYLDIDGDITSDGVVVSLDSITRYVLDAGDGAADLLDGAVVSSRAPDWIIIEESEAAFAHLGALHGTIPQIKGRRSEGRATSREVYLHLETLTRACLAKGGRVVAADALAGRLSRTILARLSGRPESSISWKAHRWTGDDPEILAYETRQDLMGELLVSIQTPNRRPVIACTSADAARRIHHILAAGGHKGLIYTADETHGRWETPGCFAVVEGWTTADYVVYSPSIDSGVNFDPADAAHRFTDVFVVGDAVAGIGWKKLVQMRHRARHHQRVHVWIARNYKHSRPTDEPSVRQEIEARWTTAKGLMIKYVADPDGSLKAVRYQDDEFLAATVTIRAHERTQWADVAASWTAYWRARGARQRAGHALSDAERRKLATVWTQAGRTVDAQYDDAVLAARHLTQAEHEQIRRRGPRSRDEALAVERVRLLDRFGGLRRGLAALDRHRERTKQVIRATRAGLLADNDCGKAHEASMGDDLLALMEGEASAVTGASSRVRVAVALASAALGPGWARALLPPALTDDSAIAWLGVAQPGVSHTPRNDRDLVDVEGGVCLEPSPGASPTTLPGCPQAEWSSASLGSSLKAVWNRVVAKLTDAPSALAGLGLSVQDIETKPTRALGIVLHYLGLETAWRQARCGGGRTRIYRVEAASWDALRDDMRRTVKRARVESVAAWPDLPDAKVPEADLLPTPEELAEAERMYEIGVRLFDGDSPKAGESRAPCSTATTLEATA